MGDFLDTTVSFPPVRSEPSSHLSRGCCILSSTHLLPLPVSCHLPVCSNDLEPCPSHQSKQHRAPLESSLPSPLRQSTFQEASLLPESSRITSEPRHMESHSRIMRTLIQHIKWHSSGHLRGENLVYLSPGEPHLGSGATGSFP